MFYIQVYDLKSGLQLLTVMIYTGHKEERTGWVGDWVGARMDIEYTTGGPSREVGRICHSLHRTMDTSYF